MELLELKAAAAKLREATGESLYCCRKALALNDYDIDKAKTWFEEHYYDSHGFVRKKDETGRRM